MDGSPESSSPPTGTEGGTSSSLRRRAGHAGAPLGRLIREGRKARSLSQRELGALLVTAEKPQGMWSTYVGQVERGKRVPPDRLVLRFAEVLQLDPRRMLAAAYQSRASTATGKRIFALAPLLLFLHEHMQSHEKDGRETLQALSCLARSRGGTGYARLLEALERLRPVDESRWNLFRNALAALRTSAGDAGTGTSDRGAMESGKSAGEPGRDAQR